MKKMGVLLVTASLGIAIIATMFMTDSPNSEEDILAEIALVNKTAWAIGKGTKVNVTKQAELMATQSAIDNARFNIIENLKEWIKAFKAERKIKAAKQLTEIQLQTEQIEKECNKKKCEVKIRMKII